MTGPAERPYGTWPSPITAGRLVEGAAKVDELRVDGDDIWWSESRPSEGGRTQLVRRTPDGERHDVLPDGSNARTRAHEYGGGAWCVAGGSVWWNDWSDQRVRRLDTTAPGAEPVLVTPEPSERHGGRWADLVVTPDGRWVVAVRETHAGQADPANEIVAVPADGSAAEEPDAVRVLVSGADFVSSPRVSADGTRLAWTQWSHPNMPWDGTELWMADLDLATCTLTGAVKVAGGPDESIVQPEWVGDDLVACSDQTGWWNPYRFSTEPYGEPEPLAPIPAEIGGPQWVFGLRWYATFGDGRLVASATADGTDGMVVVDPGEGSRRLDLPYTSISQLATARPDEVAMVAAGPATEPSPVRLRLNTGEVEVLRAPRDLGFGAEWFSAPEHLSFPSPHGAVTGVRLAHGLFYRPTNPDCTGPLVERPPLLVFIHGGPTSAARPMLQLAVQFWTSRGFAVVDVNYGGSSGYGRPYRELLDGAWGVVDVEDCVAAARHLAERGDVDGDRLAIRGGSAGGFTTLVALALTDAFSAGASHYGVADLGALARDTHKFESRYFDRLVGHWPEAKATYDQRSPINHTDGFDRPLIVFQGDEDEVVPPDQAEMIVNALAAKGVPHAYVLFEGEQHGFRRAENILRALESELWFYGRVFGFDPADDIEPVAGAVGL